jgi:hypothetical protein
MGQEGNLADLADWAGKLAGTLARIATLFHVADHADGEIPESISDLTMHDAIELGPYFIAHSRAAHQLLGGGHVAEAAKIIGWISRYGLQEFSRSQCWQGVRGRSGIQKSSDLDAPFLLLREHGYIRPLPEESGPRNGRPPERFEVNPLSQNSQNPQNSVEQEAGLE